MHRSALRCFLLSMQTSFATIFLSRFKHVWTPLSCIHLSFRSSELLIKRGLPTLVLVTGSRDHTCIVWDTNRWTYVRQLGAHCGAVSSCSISDTTGDIATASSTYLYLWSINGQLLASVNTMPTSRTHTILCTCMSQVRVACLACISRVTSFFTCQQIKVNEWDKNNVILTGGTDGIVRVSSLAGIKLHSAV